MARRGSTLNVLLIGEGAAGVQSLRALFRTDVRIVAVVTSRSTRGSASSLWEAARQLGYRTWPAKSVKDPSFADRLSSEEVDVAINVDSRYIIHPKVLAAVCIGSFNMHLGPLPQYAGRNSASWAIYRGESRYGVTVHEMTQEVDAGRIAYQSFFPLEDDDTPLSCKLKCVRAGTPLLTRLLDTAAADPYAIPLVPQDLAERQYFGREVPEGGRLIWDRPAKAVLNFVRACDYHPFSSPWGHPRVQLGNQEILILKASGTGVRSAVPPGTVGEVGVTAVAVAGADEWILLQSIQVDGRSINPGVLLRSGDRLEDGAEPGAKAGSLNVARQGSSG